MPRGTKGWAWERFQILFLLGSQKGRMKVYTCSVLFYPSVRSQSGSRAWLVLTSARTLLLNLPSSKACAPLWPPRLWAPLCHLYLSLPGTEPLAELSVTVDLHGRLWWPQPRDPARPLFFPKGPWTNTVIRTKQNKLRRAEGAQERADETSTRFTDKHMLSQLSGGQV